MNERLSLPQSHFGDRVVLRSSAEVGPPMARRTGKRTRPWKRPKVTVRRKTCHEVVQVVEHNKNDDGNQVTLKKVMKT